MKVMSAIENCRTAALGGHVARCEDCAIRSSLTIAAATGIARMQGAAARTWMQEREAELLPRALLPHRVHAALDIGDIAYRTSV